jgi:hypothetical protein
MNAKEKGIDDWAELVRGVEWVGWVLEMSKGLEERETERDLR